MTAADFSAKRGVEQMTPLGGPCSQWSWDCFKETRETRCQKGVCVGGSSTNTGCSRKFNMEGDVGQGMEIQREAGKGKWVL